MSVPNFIQRSLPDSGMYNSKLQALPRMTLNDSPLNFVIIAQEEIKTPMRQASDLIKPTLSEESELHKKVVSPPTFFEVIIVECCTEQSGLWILQAYKHAQTPIRIHTPIPPCLNVSTRWYTSIGGKKQQKTPHTGSFVLFLEFFTQQLINRCWITLAFHFFHNLPHQKAK
jgi:hypothetical protein